MSAARNLWTLVKRQPIRTVAVLRTGIALVLAFWPGLVSPEQTTAILGFAVVLLGVDEVVRQAVTPISEPTLPAGTSLTVTTPGPTADRVTVVR